VVRDAVLRDDLYMFTHLGQPADVAKRFDRIRRAAW
jgi:hypothetical protein